MHDIDSISRELKKIRADVDRILATPLGDMLARQEKSEFGGVSERLDAIESEFKAAKEAFNEVADRIDGLADRIDALAQASATSKPAEPDAAPQPVPGQQAQPMPDLGSAVEPQAKQDGH